jgi:hypothetical protein
MLYPFFSFKGTVHVEETLKKVMAQLCPYDMFVNYHLLKGMMLDTKGLSLCSRHCCMIDFLTFSRNQTGHH